MTVVVWRSSDRHGGLLVRNMELVNQLRPPWKQSASPLSWRVPPAKERDSLSSALHRAEERVQQMQLEMMRMQEKGPHNESLIAEQLRAITGLTNERNDLAQQAAQLTLLRQRLEADVEKRQTQLTEALRNIDNQQLQLSAAQRSIVTS